MENAFDAETGEITTELVQIDTTALSAIVRAEIDTQIATARQFPRSIKGAIGNILTLATLDEDTAIECIYALKRSGKPIRGPSIRLAEIIATQWGNNRSGAQVVAIDRVNKVITAEGFFHDLESNSATKSTIQRRISDSKGRIYSDDMLAVTGNAACSIAKRNAVLAGVPKGVWRKAVEAAEQIIRGDVKTLVERRDAAVKAFAHFNISPEQVFTVLEVAGIDDINIDDLVTLRGFYSALRNGETTVEELLRTSRRAAVAHEAVDNPLADAAPISGDPIKPETQEQKPAAKAAEKVPAKKPAAAPLEMTPERIAALMDHAGKRARAGAARKIPKDLDAPEHAEIAAQYLQAFDDALALNDAVASKDKEAQ